MVETIAPQIRDLTVPSRHIPIEVEAEVCCEMLLTIWRTHSVGEKPDSFDLGPEWHQRMVEATSADLEEEIVFLGGPFHWFWLAIGGLLISAPHPHDPDRVLGWLESLDPRRLRLRLLGYAAGHLTDPPLLEEAAADGEALRRLLEGAIEEWKEEKRDQFLDHALSLFSLDETELRDRLVTVLRRYRQEVFAEVEEEFGGAIARAAAARRAMGSTGPAKEVIEEVTKGLDYEIPLGVTRVVLIPSLVTRPLSILDQHRELLLVYYGMADEFVETDPNAAPSWLVRTYKALGDERRLRIVRRLSEGETTFDELVDLLGLTKSTVHHHISILRAAGLVRVHVPEDDGRQRTYSLRRQAIDNAFESLDSIVLPHPREEVGGA
jgi:DNA-binding transcriptional ArsR family regulator